MMSCLQQVTASRGNTRSNICNVNNADQGNTSNLMKHLVKHQISLEVEEYNVW